MNALYEQWGNALRDGAAALSERFEPDKIAAQLVERGAALGKKYRRKKTAITLTVGFLGGVGVTLLAVGIVSSAKKKRKKLKKTVELLRHEPEETEAQQETKETEEAES